MHDLLPESDEVLALRWALFRKSRDPQIRASLISHYLDFARMLAAKLYGRRIDDSVSFDDFLQYARTGLLEAIDRYDPEKGISFEGFGAYRIRGAILNGLGMESEAAAQRSVGTPSKFAERLSSLDSASHEPDRDLEDWVQQVVGLAIGLLLDDGTADQIDESVCANPYANVELLHIRRFLVKYVERLPTREREVIRMHYLEHLEFQMIADILDLTKSRVSQLHSNGLLLLRKLMRQYARIDDAL